MPTIRAALCIRIYGAHLLGHCGFVGLVSSLGGELSAVATVHVVLLGCVAGGKVDLAFRDFEICVSAFAYIAFWL